MKIEDLKRFEMPTIGVYFLFNNDELIYIGYSASMFFRIYSHLKEKMFNNYGFIKCSSIKECKTLEKQMIIKYQPKLNIDHKTQELNNSIKNHLKSIEKIELLKNEFGIK